MADQPTQQAQPQTSPAVEKGWEMFWNRFNRILGPYNIFRYRTYKGQPAPIKALLPITLNESLIDLLITAETQWLEMDKYLWEKEPKFIKFYELLGHYNDRAVVELEHHDFQTGGDFDYDSGAKKFYLKPVEIKWSDGNREELFIFGPANIGRVMKLWDEQSGRFEKELVDTGIDAATRPILSSIRANLSKLIKDVIQDENEHIKKLEEMRGIHDSLDKEKKSYAELTEKYNYLIRFEHTYKVIKPFYWDEINKKAIYFDPRKNMAKHRQRLVNHQPLLNHGIYRYKRFEPWPWEEHTGWEVEEFNIDLRGRSKTVRGRIMTGLDENGYPLEINDDGVVLLDKWWFEIGENQWQRDIISAKPGGAEIINRINHIRTNGIRVVDKKFTTDQAYLDTLELAVYIYNELDSFRDDLRDGRYHKHSKTTTDYIIHAEGGLKIDPNKFTIVREILKKPMPANLEFDQFDTNSDYGYIKARPDYFNNNVPTEELAVTRTYQIKEYNTVTNQLEMGPARERTPTNISPAFDRRALRRRTGLPIHWGRMYYYEDTEGINKWSENPYPHITTRGIAKYIMYWIAVRTQNLAEASDAAKSEKGYDIGIRRPLVGGAFIKNPFEDIISMGSK